MRDGGEGQDVVGGELFCLRGGESEGHEGKDEEESGDDGMVTVFIGVHWNISPTNIYNMILRLCRAHFSKMKIYLPDQSKAIISRAASTMAKVAGITLGPYGRNVLIQNEMQEPRITKDGITVVKHIEFEHRMDDAIASLIKKSVDGTNKFAGDGTTTSTILIGEIMRIAHRLIAAGESVRDIRKGLQVGRKIGISFMESCSRKVQSKEELLQVAMISTNGKKDLAELVAEAVYRSAHVYVEKSEKFQNSLQFYSGVKMTRGLESMEMANKPSGLLFNYPLVVVSSIPVKSVKSIVGCLEMAKKARKQLIIFAPDFSESVVNTLIYNSKKKIVEAACVSVPPYGDVGKDLLLKIATATGAKLFSEFGEVKMEDMGWEQFGKAVKVECDQYETKIQVKAEGNQQSLSGVIFVGGPNQTVMLENYDHIIDALNSVSTAKKDGIIAGGGITLWRLSELLSHYQGEGKIGVRILSEALKYPRKQLMQYVGAQNKSLGGVEWEGYNLKTGRLEDMFAAGIVDSVTVGKSTLIDSISLCSVLVEVEIGVMREDSNLSSVSLKALNKKYSL